MPAQFNIVLFEPAIPPNTGSIARLCACTGAHLHLIHPLGFSTDEKSLKRAGLDYWDHVGVTEHDNWQSFINNQQPEHLYLFSKFATRSYFKASFQTPGYLVFGSETHGLPEGLRADYQDHLYQIPMRTHLVRSLNLAQAAAIALYEALRQN